MNRLRLWCLCRWFYSALSLRTFILGAFILSAVPSAAYAAESALKAALLYRFVQFTQWSQDAPANQFYCVAGDQAVFSALQAALQQHSRQDGDKSKLLLTVKDGSDCTVLYISDTLAKQNEWLPLLRAKGVLIIVEGAELFRKGAHFGLIAEPNRISFRVNLTLAREQGFQLSAQMLKLAKEIH